MGKRIHRGRNDAGSLLAATFVAALGAGSTIFVVIALAPQNSTWLVGGISAGMILILGIIAMLRFGKMPSLGLGFWSVRFRNHRSDGVADDYVPRIRKNRGRNDGGNQPITAGEAKELRETSASTWIPADKSRS